MANQLRAQRLVRFPKVHSWEQRLLASLTVAATLAAPPALAAPGFWDSFEARVPISDGDYGLPSLLRFSAENRFADAGLGLSLLRVGPIWEAMPNLLLAAHVVTAIEQDASGGIKREYRAELEPTVRWRWRGVACNNRNILDFRSLTNGPRWRYRNRLWMGFQLEGVQWGPYVSDEVYLDLSGSGFSENQAVFGIGYIPIAGTQFNSALLVRSRLVSSATWDHTLVLQAGLLFSPSTRPPFELDGYIRSEE